MQENRNQPGQEQQNGLEGGNAGKNKTVGAPGSNVPDYGRSRQREENEKGLNRQDEEDKEIPLGNEETIGNP